MRKYQTVINMKKDYIYTHIYIQVFPRIHLLSIRGFSYTRVNADRKKMGKLKKKSLMSFKTCAKIERAVKGKGKGRFFGVYSVLRLCKLIVPLPLRTSFLRH
jgi:hypothetical protein